MLPIEIVTYYLRVKSDDHTHREGWFIVTSPFNSKIEQFKAIKDPVSDT